MPTWKKNIFLRVLRTRMQAEGRSVDALLADYPLLTEAEKTELRAELEG